MTITKRALLTVIFLASSLGGLTVYVLIESFGSNRKPIRSYISISNRQQEKVNENPEDYSQAKDLGFDEAAEKVIPGVVHIKTYYGELLTGRSLGGNVTPQFQSSGSGVIISDDGYIVTNNHVIEESDRIEVTLHDNRSYYASIVGVDKTTDLALLRIDARRLPFIKYGDSDQIKIGDWVLAVGNPFLLNFTVTAGIVSAKARNISAFDNSIALRVESFIQTDAALNPGNSGGALINLKGELIGINTAIASQSGSYEGYSFAIPVTLVRKIMDDLLEYGEVKRGLLGVMINDVDARFAEANDLMVLTGVHINSLTENGAGRDAGLQEGDVIIAIDGHAVKNTSELQERVARKRPGDQIEVAFLRGNEEKMAKIILRDYAGETVIEKRKEIQSLRGGTFETLPKNQGVKLTADKEGFWLENDVPLGFTITHLDKVRIFNVDELINNLEMKTGPVLLEGISPTGTQKFQAIDW